MTRRKLAAAAIVLAALLGATGCHTAPHCNYAVSGVACVRP